MSETYNNAAEAKEEQKLEETLSAAVNNAERILKEGGNLHEMRDAMNTLENARSGLMKWDADHGHDFSENYHGHNTAISAVYRPAMALKKQIHSAELSQEPEMTPWQTAVIWAELSDFEKSIRTQANNATKFYVRNSGLQDMPTAEAVPEAKRIDMRVRLEYYGPLSMVRETVQKAISGEITRKEAEEAISSSPIAGKEYEKGNVLPQLKTYLTQNEPPLQKPLHEIRKNLIGEMDSAEKQEEKAAVSYAMEYTKGRRNEKAMDEIKRQGDRIYKASKTAYVIQEAADNGCFKNGGVSFTDITERGEALTRECSADISMGYFAGRGYFDERKADIPDRIRYNAYKRGQGKESNTREKEAELGE